MKKIFVHCFLNEKQKKYLEKRFTSLENIKILKSISKQNFINYFKRIFTKNNLKIIIYSSKRINISI